MELGFSLDPKTEAFNFGTRSQEALNSCFKAIRILSFQWLLAQCPLRVEAYSLRARAICGRGSGSIRILDHNKVSYGQMIVIKRPHLSLDGMGPPGSKASEVASLLRGIVSLPIKVFWGVVIVKQLLKFMEEVIREAS